MNQREEMCNIIRTYTQQKGDAISMQEMVGNLFDFIKQCKFVSSDQRLTFSQLTQLSNFMTEDKSNVRDLFTRIEDFIYHPPHHLREEMTELEFQLILMMVYAAAYNQSLHFH